VFESSEEELDASQGGTAIAPVNVLNASYLVDSRIEWKNLNIWPICAKKLHLP
jgi:hypothetical protein